MTIEVFADVVCPFTHVGLRRLTDRRDRSGSTASVRVRAWPLELVNGEPLPVGLVAEEVEELRKHAAPDLFVGFDPTTFPSSALPALALAAAAYRSDDQLGERVSLALRHALFEQGRDVASDEVLADVARRHGVPRVGPSDHDRVLADWHEGERRSVRGSPHYFVGGDDFFCPALEIKHVDGRLRIDADPIGFDRFVERALDAA